MSAKQMEIAKPAADEVLLITSGDLRLAANQECWPAQKEMEAKLTAAFAQQGVAIERVDHGGQQTVEAEAEGEGRNGVGRGGQRDGGQQQGRQGHED